MKDEDSKTQDDTPLRATKDLSLEVTSEDPSILDEYRASKIHASPVLTHDSLDEVTDSPPPDWDALLKDVTDLASGKANATKYHRAVEALLKALFWPALDFNKREFPIYQGRKRIDITFDNIARSGFFDWIRRSLLIPSGQVYVECKNYGKDIENPEVDQLAQRFSDARGRFGILTYRGFGDKELLVQRCRDTAGAGNGFILALEDSDFAAMVEEKKRDPDGIKFKVLQRRLEEIMP